MYSLFHNEMKNKQTIEKFDNVPLFAVCIERSIGTWRCRCFVSLDLAATQLLNVSVLSNMRA